MIDKKNAQLYKTLDALQVLRTTKNAGDFVIHPKMDAALKECKDQDKTGELEIMLRRLMIHIGDISRQHNILKKFSIVSTTGGAQERSNFRSLLRWWESKMSESFYKDETLEAIYEFTVAENLIYNEIRSDKKTGKILNVEYMEFDKQKIAKFISKMIIKGKDVSLWAKHLPKAETGKSRTAKKKMKMRQSLKDSGTKSFNWSIPYEVEPSKIKVNGLFVDNFTVAKDGKKAIIVKDGDIVSYPRKKQAVTLERQKRDLEIAKLISNELNLETVDRETKDGKIYTDYTGYKSFRKKQDTVQQKICSGEIFDLSKADFTEMLNHMTSATQFRVAKMIAYKAENGELTPKEGKWNRLGKVYIDWVKSQEKVADKLRKAAASGDETAERKAMKEFKVKTTGMQTIDILAEVVKGGLSDSQINNAYQSLIEKMDMVANVFVVLDGSGSMSNTLRSGQCSNWGTPADVKYSNLTLYDVAATLAIAFTTRNPEIGFRNTFAWFSRDVYIIGDSKFIDERPNKFVSKSAFNKEVPKYQILSETYTFTENFANLKKANPSIAQSTNMMAIVEYFVKLVQDGKFTIEQIPQALLFITDNEGNSGKSPKSAIELANSIGWYPLLIFWGLEVNSMDQYKNLSNTLFVGGFSESVLSQILRGIKTGSINPEDELRSIYEDTRYSIIK